MLVVTRPFSRDGGMAKDHGAPEAGQLPKASTRGRRETESRQRASGAESIAGLQNERRDMLGRVSTGRILDFANPREIT